MVDGKMAFPNATIHVEQAEVSYWISQERMAKSQAMEREFFEGAIASLTAYSQAGRIKPFDAGTARISGHHGAWPHRRPYGLRGENEGEQPLVIGDLIHVGAAQLHGPGVGRLSKAGKTFR